VVRMSRFEYKYKPERKIPETSIEIQQRERMLVKI
jgi:hypothetical protein